jgi:hypothetical protein
MSEFWRGRGPELLDQLRDGVAAEPIAVEALDPQDIELPDEADGAVKGAAHFSAVCPASVILMRRTSIGFLPAIIRSTVALTRPAWISSAIKARLIQRADSMDSVSPSELSAMS